MCLQPPGLRAHKAVSHLSGSQVISDLTLSCCTALLSCLALKAQARRKGFCVLLTIASPLSQKHHLRIKGVPKAFLSLQIGIPRDSQDRTHKKC